MGRKFNVNGDCKPGLHYMVNVDTRLREIRKMVDNGDYFTINRARQYGKTTTLRALARFLEKDYLVISMDFQVISTSKFRDENTFSLTFAELFVKEAEKGKGGGKAAGEALGSLKQALQSGRAIELFELFGYLSGICRESEKPVVLMIDEVDSASNHQVFLDFLAQLRRQYIGRDQEAAFWSVILAGVCDIKNIRYKIRPDGVHRYNSPWNIAADFLVDMSFSAEDIAGMLEEYEGDYVTGMDIRAVAGEIYNYTSGYPFLVSRICKLIDERIAGGVGNKEGIGREKAWTKAGVPEAVKILLMERNTLFESLVGKLDEMPGLRDLIYSLLFQGKGILYHPLNKTIETAEMFGFIRNASGYAVISNRIFETFLYNLFLSEEALASDMYETALQDRNRFVLNGRLDMRLVLERFVVHFTDIYGTRDASFLEETGRKYFLLYLKPIINGTGNYYIESRTRNLERTDVVVDYGGEQFVIELKIWRGNAYHERGEAQLADYLDYYHLKKGYMLSFNFNKKKKVGVREIMVGDKLLVEAVV